jgi:starch-binding outer membrane protein, SusD/RagB family
MRTHNTKPIVALIVAGTLAVGACNFDVTNPNSPPAIGPNATPAQVAAAAVGLLVGLRVDYSNWVQKTSIFAREGYRLDVADPRFTTELLAGPLDPTNNAFGGGQWQPEYRTIQSGYAILNVIGTAQLPDSEKIAVRGFVRTIQALSFLNVLNAHIQDSIPIDVNRSIDQPLAPFVRNDSGYKAVIAILDSARQDLLAAGSPAGSIFPFDLGPGFTGFKTPATFLQFNRALAARVRTYRASLGALAAGIYGPAPLGWTACAACWDSVLTALQASFINNAASLDLGAYNAFGTGNLDVPNTLSQDPASAVNVAHPFLKDSAELQAASTLRDRRFLAKITDRADTLTLNCLKSALSWTRYPTPNSPIPIIRNEELFLLRAEANWFGVTGSKAQSILDLNFIRQNAGNLPATTVTIASTDAEFVNALLRERLYSLLYEGGHRWIDLRRYGRLGQIIRDRPNACSVLPGSGITKPDIVFSSLPINLFEVQARQ